MKVNFYKFMEKQNRENHYNKEDFIIIILIMEINSIKDMIDMEDINKDINQEILNKQKINIQKKTVYMLQICQNLLQNKIYQICLVKLNQNKYFSRNKKIETRNFVQLYATLIHQRKLNKLLKNKDIKLKIEMFMLKKTKEMN